MGLRTAAPRPLRPGSNEMFTAAVDAAAPTERASPQRAPVPAPHGPHAQRATRTVPRAQCPHTAGLFDTTAGLF